MDFKLNKKKTINAILLVFLTAFGILAIFSFFITISYNRLIHEKRFWAFMTITSFLAMWAMLPLMKLVEKIFFSPKKEKKAKSKENWTKIDYFSLFLLIVGLIIEGIVIIGFAYISILVPYHMYENLTFFNIPFITFVYIFAYTGVIMSIIGLFIILIFHLKSDETLRKRYELKHTQNDHEVEC